MEQGNKSCRSIHKDKLRWKHKQLLSDEVNKLNE